ncbi:MAG: cytidine deaminase [Lachnospiraceae bacterium]|nr:cytidine deaminase [Lachnospiraceae bacterium]
MQEEEIRELIATALLMMERAYAPYSHFQVGAALLGKSGMIYTGCNIENAAYAPSNCAERTAFFKGVSEGEQAFTAIAIVGGPDGMPKDYVTPCGVCRQVMAEFCDPEEFQVILATDRQHYEVCTLGELFPRGFGPGDLSKK